MANLRTPGCHLPPWTVATLSSLSAPGSGSTAAFSGWGSGRRLGTFPHFEDLTSQEGDVNTTLFKSLLPYSGWSPLAMLPILMLLRAVLNTPSFFEDGFEPRQCAYSTVLREKGGTFDQDFLQTFNHEGIAVRAPQGGLKDMSPTWLACNGQYLAWVKIHGIPRRRHVLMPQSFDVSGACRDGKGVDSDLMTSVENVCSASSVLVVPTATRLLSTALAVLLVSKWQRSRPRRVRFCNTCCTKRQGK